MKANRKYEDVTVPIAGLDGNEKLSALGGLKGKLALFLSFSNPGGELCRLKEFELARGDVPAPNRLQEVNTPPADSRHGRIEAVPTKGRMGESIKLNVFPDKGYVLQTIRVVDSKGNEIKLAKNGAAPYAPDNYHFEMPACVVGVSAQFVKVSE